MYQLVKKNGKLIQNLSLFTSQLKKKKKKDCGTLVKKFFSQCYLFEPEKESDFDKVQMNFMRHNLKIEQ